MNFVNFLKEKARLRMGREREVRELGISSATRRHNNKATLSEYMECIFATRFFGRCENERKN